jgi:hypothetical protein
MCVPSQYSLLRHLCWSILLNRDPKRVWVGIMTEFSLYLDDSGHPSNQPYVVVAGYVSTESNWLAFEPEWDMVLDRFNLDRPFHMTDFMSSNKYSTLKRDQILFSLSHTINSHVIWPFASAVDMEAWKRVNDEFTLEECHGAPFALAARSVAKQVNEWRNEHLSSDDHLLMFIEEGTKNYGDLEQVFKRDGIPIPNRVPKAMHQVQPCDLLAWEAFNFVRSGQRLGKNLSRLIRRYRKERDLGGTFTEADLRRLCADTNVYPRSTIKPGDTIAFHSERKRKRKPTVV